MPPISCRSRSSRPRRLCRFSAIDSWARAFRWRQQLDDGVHATLEDLARAKGVAPSYVSRVLRLTLLAPEIVEAILDGNQPVDLQLDHLLGAFPLEWVGQRELLAEPSPTPGRSR